MKYKGPPMVAIFFMTSFNSDRGACPPPLDPQLAYRRPKIGHVNVIAKKLSIKKVTYRLMFLYSR